MTAMTTTPITTPRTTNVNWPRRRTARLAAVLLATTLAPASALLGAADAAAKGRTVTRIGRCSNGATWKLKANTEDGGRIGVEFEVDANRNGQRWSVVLTDNGAVVFSGVRTTLAPSGSFSVERRIVDRPGVDHLTARAVRLATGATCRGSLDF